MGWECVEERLQWSWGSSGWRQECSAGKARAALKGKLKCEFWTNKSSKADELSPICGVTLMKGLWKRRVWTPGDADLEPLTMRAVI